jgi:transcriptional regulator with PAS, ATPase and Fis domain
MQELIKSGELLEFLNEGIIIISNEFKLAFINDKAKSILDINDASCYQHLSGIIAAGDIVVLADNRIDSHCDNIPIKDLGMININDKNIIPNDIFLGIGIYNTKKSKPCYKYRRVSETELIYTMSHNYLGYQIDMEIDEVNKNMKISIDNTDYTLKYLSNACHIVIIDGSTGKVKFFQKLGYSYRNEDAGNLLNGKKYMGTKIHNLHSLLGLEIKDDNELFPLRKLVESVSLSDKRIVNSIIKLRERQIVCSVSSITYKDKPQSYIVKINQISDIKEMIKQKNTLIDLVLSAEEHSNTTIQDEYAKKVTGVSGKSTRINTAKYLGFKAAGINTTVLLTGESGTGKTLLAKEIHRLSNNSSAFFHVNCGAIPVNLFESELFGYEKGSFTGASSSGKKGYFEMADNGTIFLDEVGELPHDIQSKLLHVLQEKSFYKVGASSPTTVNTRVIAATNVDLTLAVKENRFRRDLYYRLNVFPIQMPPLRERKNDLRLLINNILENLIQRYQFPEKILAEESYDKLMGYDWPGNIRELENILERAAIISETNTIYSEHLNINNSVSKESLKDIIAEAEKKAILETLEACNNNKKITMRKLGISKSTFYEKLGKYDIDIQ